jgi:glycosyltransferase
MATSAPKISVITVCFNSGKTIVDTLRSVAEQTWPHVEHLVIDGGSTDNTLDLIRNNAARVARLISEPDSGIYDAMNKGIALATGDWIGFLNADDVFASAESLALIARSIDEVKGADAVYGDLNYVHAERLQAVIRRWRSAPFQPQMLKQGWMPPHPTLYVRREVLAAVGGFDTRYRIAADYEMILRIFARPGRQYVHLPEVLVHMRTGGASNRSLRALWRKSSEDYQALRRHRVGGVGALLWKNLSKVTQFLPKG